MKLLLLLFTVSAYAQIPLTLDEIPSSGMVSTRNFHSHRIPLYRFGEEIGFAESKCISRNATGSEISKFDNSQLRPFLFNGEDGSLKVWCCIGSCVNEASLADSDSNILDLTDPKILSEYTIRTKITQNGRTQMRPLNADRHLLDSSGFFLVFDNDDNPQTYKINVISSRKTCPIVERENVCTNVIYERRVITGTVKKRIHENGIFFTD